MTTKKGHTLLALNTTHDVAESDQLQHPQIIALPLQAGIVTQDMIAASVNVHSLFP